MFIFLCEKLGKALSQKLLEIRLLALFSICVCVCLHAWTSEAFSEAQNEGGDYCGPNEPRQSGIICDNEISLCSGKAAFSGKCKHVAGCKILLPTPGCAGIKYPHFCAC